MAVGSQGQLFEEWLELKNGCLCCSVKSVNFKLCFSSLYFLRSSGRDFVQHFILFVYLYFNRDNGVKAIENLMKRKGKFDYILLETTGLADPG